MRRTPAPAAPLASPDYYERLGRLQHGLRDSEKKRLDLERKLYEYSQSDTCRVKLKYVKLKKYLKEIGESEKKAHTRNQKYLKWCEGVQAHIGHFTTNTEKLQELKVEYEIQIKKMQLLSKDSLGIKDKLKDEDREKVAVQAGVNSGIAVSRGMYQPATIFMGRQMSAISSIGDFSTEQKSPQPTKNFSIPNPHSCQQTAQSGNVTDSCVVQTTQCLKKPDKIDGETSLQIDCLPHGIPESRRTFRKTQEEPEEESWSSSSDLTVSVSEDDLILKSPELQPSPYDKMEGEDGIKALRLIHSEQERDALLTPPKNCILQSLSSPDSKEEPSTNSPSRESESPPHSDLPRAQLGQRVTTLDEQDSSLKEEVAKPTDVFTVKNEHQRMKATALLKKARTEECEDRSSIHSSESSCSLPSVLSDNGGVKEANLSLWLSSVHTRKQEVSSRCRDESKEESVGTKIPITGLERWPGCKNFQMRIIPRVCPLYNEASLSTFRHRRPRAGSRIFRCVESGETYYLLLLGPGTPTSYKTEGTTLCCFMVTSPSLCGRDQALRPDAGGLPPTAHETKAYQLLKQSTLQDNTHRTEDRFQKAGVSASQLAGLNMGSGTVKTKTTNKIASEENFSSRRGSPLSRHEDESKPTTNLKSKASAACVPAACCLTSQSWVHQPLQLHESQEAEKPPA
ncbi:centrosomal protein kizuna isoform X7 [Elephas maximus indicus]|uniref:centrosomal protein kizuna isoform X7 n=1 Tax=Elephas maximus indicus TaxID=99487 RepID=UPI002115CE16|nr:centrosomal protein kizuna isoform X7 [Elephas maximus indicus]